MEEMQSRASSDLLEIQTGDWSSQGSTPFRSDESAGKANRRGHRYRRGLLRPPGSSVRSLQTRSGTRRGPFYSDPSTRHAVCDRSNRNVQNVRMINRSMLERGYTESVTISKRRSNPRSVLQRISLFQGCRRTARRCNSGVIVEAWRP
jgi:hypothetical protein